MRQLKSSVGGLIFNICSGNALGHIILDFAGTGAARSVSTRSGIVDQGENPLLVLCRMILARASFQT